MFKVGRVCVKLAGREAGTKCVIVEQLDKNYVLIDGPVKRRRCNVKHLMPLEYELDLKEGAKSQKVTKALIDAEIITKPAKKKSKPQKKKQPRPKKQRERKKKPEKKKK